MGRPLAPFERANGTFPENVITIYAPMEGD
jgi:hypothetical protein